MIAEKLPYTVYQLIINSSNYYITKTMINTQQKFHLYSSSVEEYTMTVMKS